MLPETVKLPPIVGLVTKPTVTSLSDTVMSVSFDTPLNVNVSPPLNVSVLEPSESVNEVAMAAVVAAVICPCALTVRTGIAVVEPYESAVTPVSVKPTVSAATVIPVPAPMFSVTSPVVPPPVKPEPATTLSMSPASLVKLITPVELSYEISPEALIAPLALASVK